MTWGGQVGAIAAVLATLLLIAGLAKWRHPASAAHLVPSMSPWSMRTSVRLIALAELGLGVVALTLGGTLPTALLGATYLGFAVVALRQRRSGTNCGCFGEESAPTTWLHVSFDVFAGALASTAAMLDPHPFHQRLDGTAELLLAGTLVIVTAHLCRLLLTYLPGLETARRTVLGRAG